MRMFDFLGCMIGGIAGCPLTIFQIQYGMKLMNTFLRSQREIVYLIEKLDFFSPVNLLKKLFIPRQETVLLSPDFAEILSRQTVVVGEGGVGRGQGPELTQSEIYTYVVYHIKIKVRN